jgi:hypothetical protein
MGSIGYRDVYCRQLLIYILFNFLPESGCLQLKSIAGLEETKRCVVVLTILLFVCI